MSLTIPSIEVITQLAPDGVAPDMAREIAQLLGVEISFAPFVSPGEMPGAKILDGYFTTIQQAAGTRKENTAASVFLQQFIEEVKSSGLVDVLIARHKVVGRLSAFK